MNVVSGWGNQIYHEGVGWMLCDRAQMLRVGIQATVASEGRPIQKGTVCNHGSTHIPVPLRSLLQNARVNEKEGRRNNLQSDDIQ